MRINAILLQTVLVLSALNLSADLACAQQAGQAPAGGVSAGEPRFRAVRTISGSKGKQEGGRFVLQDPRTVFYVPEDKEVIVYFEWEGPLGQHEFEGLWKNPDGKISVIADFKYEAKEKRFGAYWSLTTTETIATGLWTLEARIDGEAAGSHTFQILSAAKPPTPAEPPLPRVLLTAEIYQRLLAATVTIETFDQKGERYNTGSGFVLADNQVVTAFQVIDGASGLRVTLPDGRRVNTETVLTWNRKQDWAIVSVPGAKATGLERVKPDAWSIGDRCFGLDTAPEGSRIIEGGSIVGKQNPRGAGERISVGIAINQAATGGAVLNEYGNVLGMFGGTLLPGATPLQATQFTSPVYGLRIPQGGLAVPISLIPSTAPQSAPRTLADLQRSGQFVLPLTAARHVSYGVLAKAVDRKGPAPMPVEERFEFSRRDPKIGLLVTWQPKEKLKTVTTIRFYDIENQLLGESKPSKIRLAPNVLSFTSLELPISGFQPGIYRVDVMLGLEPAWRAFFRIAD
jgi:S1-C subfamily serine protease